MSFWHEARSLYLVVTERFATIVGVLLEVLSVCIYISCVICGILRAMFTGLVSASAIITSYQPSTTAFVEEAISLHLTVAKLLPTPVDILFDALRFLVYFLSFLLLCYIDILLVVLDWMGYGDNHAVLTKQNAAEHNFCAQFVGLPLDDGNNKYQQHNDLMASVYGQ